MVHRRALRAAIVVACSLLASNALADVTDPPPATAPASASAPLAAVEPMVNVHIETPEEVELEVQRGDQWVTACKSPCDRVLSVKDNYRINGSGVRASKPFRIQDTGMVRIDVEPASSVAQVIGIVLVITGGAGLVPGLGVTGVLVTGMVFGVILICPIVAALSENENHAYGKCLGDIAVAVGELYAKPWVWAPAAGGLVLIIGGGALLAGSSGTQVKVTNPPTKTAFLRSTTSPWRTPTWRNVEPVEMVLPPVMTVPVLRYEF